MGYILITHTKIGDKRIMLNYKSKPKEVDEFMNKWQKKAEYWFIKNISKQYDCYQSFINAMLSKAFHGRKTIISDYVEYNPEKGVNWIVCGIARYYDKFALPYYETCMFCYYKTAASMSAFIRINLVDEEGEEKHSGILFYTDHFFLRLKSRLEKDASMDSIVKSFLWNVGNVVMRDKKSDDGNEVELTMKFPDDGYGFGRLMEDDGVKLFGIKTFLKRSQLFPHQLRDVKELEEFEKKVEYYPKELEEVKGKLDKCREELGIHITDCLYPNKDRYTLTYN